MEGQHKIPHSHHLRLGRYSCPDQIYLITTNTLNRRPLFHNFKYGRIVVEALRAYQECADTLCFVIMPDHLHWLMSLKNQYELSRTIAGIKRYSARRINTDLGINGPLWQYGFHDRAIRQYEDVRQIARYVIGNPIRAGLVSHIGDYPLWDAKWLD